MVRMGKEFEELVAGTVQSLHPTAEIRSNRRIRGVDSNSLREIDVSMDDSYGLTIFECKDLKKPVGLDAVDKIVSVREAVKANRAALVAAYKFTESAKTSSKSHGIAPLVVIDPAGAPRWRRSFTANAICAITLIQSMRIRLVQIANGEELHGSSLCAEVFDHHLQPLGRIHDVIFDYSELPTTEVTLLHHPLLNGTVLLRDKDDLIEVAIIGSLKVRTESWKGKLDLIDGRGLYNVLTHLAVLPTASKFAAIDFSTIRDKWERINVLAEEHIGNKLFIQVVGMHPSLHSLNHCCQER